MTSCPFIGDALPWRAVRNGLLLAAIAFALIATPARADAPSLVLGTPVVHNAFEVDVPYTLSRTDVAKLGLAIKRPGEADFEFVDYYDAQPAGSLHTLWKDMAGGETRFRVTAVAGDNSVLETAEVAKTIEGMTVMGSLVPNFGEQTVGVTGETKRVRLEGWDHVYFMPLLVRGITTSSEEFKVVREDCTGRAVRLDGCHIDITFTPAELGARTARLQLDANSFGNELNLRGVGIAPVPDPPLAIPEPVPAPAPTRIVEEPSLAFDAAPSRTSTKLSRLRLEHVPAGSTVTVRCAKGCPAKTYTKRGAGGTVSLARFASRRLKVGTSIKVTLAEPGRPVRTATITIRRAREPRVSGTL